MRCIKDEIAELKVLEKQFKILLEDGRHFVAKLEEDRLVMIPCRSVTKEQELDNCRAMSEYFFPRLRTIAWNQLSESDFHTFRQVIDDYYLYVKKVTTPTSELRAWTLALKLGGKIPPTYLLQKESEAYREFILKNFLHHWFFALRLQVPYNAVDGPALPIKGKGWVLWKEIKQEQKKDKIQFWFGEELLFETQLSYAFTPDYICFYDGIQQYNMWTDPSFTPFDKRNPEEWGCKHVLEVWTLCQNEPRENPSMFIHTHAFFVIRDDKGFLRSAGQDVIYDIQQCKKTELLSHKPGYGKISTPDTYVAFPKNARQFWKASLEITKEEHDKIVEIVKRDKLNKNHSISIMKKNCTSYVLKILKEALGLELDVSMHGIHILTKSILPDEWYRKGVRKWESWYQQRSPRTKKLLFFFPLFYVPYLLLATVAALSNRNSYQDQTDFRFLDIVLRPWKLTFDHPLALHRQLEKYINGKK